MNTQINTIADLLNQLPPAQSRALADLFIKQARAVQLRNLKEPGLAELRDLALLEIDLGLSKPLEETLAEIEAAGSI